MTATISEFIASLSSPVRGFPPSLRQIYAELIEEFRKDPAAKSFDQMGTWEGFKDPTLRGVAYRMYRWFPTHFFKFQDVLLRWEQQCRESGQAFLLERPNVTFVDLGCGAGAASAAVLATLEQYQEFCKIRNVKVDPIRVNLVGLDPAPLELDAYTRLISTYASAIAKRKIYVEFQTISQRFPEGSTKVIDGLSSLRGHVLIVGMSNLINWIWDEWDAHWEKGDLSAIEKLSPAEIEALRRLAEETDFDSFHVVGIATRKPQFLSRKLVAFFSRLVAAFKRADRPFGKRWGVNATVLFENPEGSHWVNVRPQGTSNYFVENLVDVAPDYVQDKRLHGALSLKSLEAAWAKARTHMRYESLTDEVELRLFENNLETNLKRLRAACLDRDYLCLNVDCHLPYQFPKDEQTTRPRSLARLEEQIVAATVGVSFTKELEGPCPEVSYSYRLAPMNTEFLYQYWFALYREYLSAVLKQLDENYVCLADIKSFYVNISQAKLLDILRKRLRQSDHCYELLAATVEKDCGSQHLMGYGLIQGHSLSGLLSNVMLQPADYRLVNHRGMRGRYFRFTDDITVTGTAGPTGNARGVIQEELSALDERLELNSAKTYYFDQAGFKRRVYSFKELDTVAKRFRALLLPLFVINLSYRRELSRGEWQFVYEYQGLLKRIGVSFTPEWLCRKLGEYGRLWRQLRVLRRRWKLDWPALSLIRSELGRLEWQQQFTSRNQDWMKERQALKSELSRMLVDAASDIIPGRLPEDKLMRRRRVLKFALHRLSIFGVDDALPEIVQLLISQPWNIPVGIACQALTRIKQEDALVEVLQYSQFSYVRAMALRALGKIRTGKSVSILASVLDGQAEPIEKLMASEGLLDANLWREVELNRVLGWLEQDSEQPYTQKNVVLILGQAYPEEARNVLLEMENGSLHRIVHRAIHYVLTKPPSENLLWKAEPEVLKKYRARFYPTIEELLGDRGSYGFMSE